MQIKERYKFFEKLFYEKSSFQKIFKSELVNISTKNSKWNEQFAIALTDMLHSKQIIPTNDIDLRDLHNIIDKKYFVCETKGKDNNSRPLISDIGFEFIESNQSLYFDFVKHIYTDVVKENFYFQKTPTIRFHIPEYNKHLFLPAWHCDSILGHSPKEINIWFSLTNNKHSDFWIGDLEKTREWLSEYNFDFEKWKKTCFTYNKQFVEKGYKISKPAADIYNNIIMFDSRCIHAATYRDLKDMTTKITIDLRIILTKDFEWVKINNKPVYVGDGIQKAEFRPGLPYGYHQKSIKELI